MNDFYRYFSENMAALNMPVPPASLFASVNTAATSIGLMAEAIKTFGATATLREVLLTIPSFGAAASDLWVLGSAISASFYVGACIGSTAVAIGRTLSGGKQIADFFAVGRRSVDDPALLLRCHQDYQRACSRAR